ncbi:ralA-binding protein 1-like [Diaphorina citri]|uniref:RalA-binding protein 1-like n=1 Tax=Diaphorina citri TaxID=121845 RepID=A0A3Q0IWR8_DIACI|nr:ralA-binding protein 1-like [Diaphorina citri]
MEFESPDVERDFPGLYASESAKKGNDSDFSDESFDSKLSKKDLLIGKRKEKKDRGYATLEGESSPDEEVKTCCTSSQRSIEESTEDSEFTLNLNLQQVKQDPVSTDAKPESADKDKTSAEDKAPPTAEATEVIIEKVPSDDGKTSADQKAASDVTVESARVAVNSVQSAEPVSVTSASPPGSIQSSVSICSERNERSLADEDDSASIVSEGDFILKGLKLESTELLNLANFLQEAILDEKLKIAALQQKILSHPNFNNNICPCHDGVNIPLVVRECIDHVEAHGLTTDQVYKVSGLKSKVQQLKLMYNRREPVVLTHVDIPVVTSLLKLFLRELPEPILSSELLNKFEEVGVGDDMDRKIVKKRGNFVFAALESGPEPSEKPAPQQPETLKADDKFGSVNKIVLAWLLPHLNHVSQQEKCNKMSSQNIASVMSPVLQMSSKLLSALLFHCESILPHVVLRQYVPPLTCTSPALPDTTPAIQEELKKQDSLLSQLHAEMNAGFVSKQREEQLWEVQRMITQLKRKLRVLEKGTSSQRSIEESTEDSEFTLNLNLQQVKQDPVSIEAKPESADKDKTATSAEDKVPPTAEATEVIIEKVPSEDGKTSVDQKAVNEVTVESARVAVNSVQSAEPVSVTSASPPGSIQSSVSICSERNERSLADEDDSASLSVRSLQLYNPLYNHIPVWLHLEIKRKLIRSSWVELYIIRISNLANFLQEAILDEKLKIAALQQKILSHPNFNNNIESLSIPLTLNDNADPTSEIVKESMRLEIRKENLIRSIIEEREAILDLKVQILMKQGGSIPA